MSAPSPAPQPSWAAAHAQRRRGGPLPAVVHKEPCPGSDQNVMPLASLLLRPSLLVDFRPFLSLWPFTNTSEKNQTRVRVPVVMHVFHMNKIVIISFSEVSIPATLSRSSAQTAHMQAGLRHARRPALCTPSIFLVAPLPSRFGRGGETPPPLLFSSTFLDRYISLALAGMQQDRNSGLARNYGAAIREKSVQ